MAIDGLVASPRRLDLPALRQFPFATIEAVHQCAGNPLEPHALTQRVCNVVWGGYRLADVLAACGPAPEARFIWSYGADWGVFEGVSIDATARICRSSAERGRAARGRDERAPLRPENGFPSAGGSDIRHQQRQVADAADARRPIARRGRSRRAGTMTPCATTPAAQTGALRPVWNVAPQSVIVAPNAQTQAARRQASGRLGLGLGGQRHCGGDDRRRRRELRRGCRRAAPVTCLAEVRGVVDARAARAPWSSPPAPPAQDGETQPADGARNAIHRVVVTVAK